MSNNSKKILLIGATGLTGAYVLDLLQASSYCDSLVIWGRKAPAELGNKSKFYSEIGNELQCELTNVDTVICCLGTTIKKAGSQENFRYIDLELPMQIARLAREEKIPCFCLMSAVGANKDSNNFYLRVKGSLEMKLQALNFPELHIMRPSLLLGPRKEFRFGESAAKLFTPLFNPLLFGRMSPYKAIHAKEVAKALAFRAIQAEKADKFTISHYKEIRDLASKWDELHINRQT
ncbi:MAG: hypothetical protein ACK4GL_09210 [Flavobacteriales bacterium]